VLLSAWQAVYLSVWSCLSVIAAVTLLVRRHETALLQRGYWRSLLRPWKLAFFVAGFVGIVWMAPHTGDPTWDYYDAGLMAALAYTTAPWSVGVLYRTLRGKRQWVQAACAVVVWLFGASWSYDGYLVVRDGLYPASWAANLPASSFLYLMAGLLWSLEDHPKFGLAFSFQMPTWPEVEGVNWSRRLALCAAAVAAPVAGLFVYMLFAW
jgi:hypothetical protein